MSAVAWIAVVFVAMVGAGVLVLCLFRVSSEESRREEQQELARRIAERGIG